MLLSKRESIQILMPSSVIEAMHYDEPSRVLTMIFRGNRGMYRYFDVPPQEWAAFQTAPSKGAHLNEVFKARNFRYEKVREQAA